MLEAHPDFERLLQWQEGEFGDPEASQVASHVSGCAFCSHRVERLASIARVIRSGPWLRPSEQARQVAYDSRQMGSLPGVRAESPDGQHLLFTSTQADIAISLREQPGGQWSLLGQVLADEPELSQPAEVLAISEALVVAQATTTDLGNFTLDDLVTGRYRLLVLLPHLRLETPEIALAP
jgi:hypothetical protein